MDSSQILEIGAEGIWVMLSIAMPVMLTALFVGLIISLFQALTQIQEMTLSFVPKIIAISFAILIFLPMMGGGLITYAEELYQKIAEIESYDADG